LVQVGREVKRTRARAAAGNEEKDGMLNKQAGRQTADYRPYRYGEKGE